MTKEKIRLNKFLANARIAENRKKAESLILSGAIKVNSEIIKNPAHKISLADSIYFLDKEVDPTPIFYILYNKPKGVPLDIENHDSDYYKYLVSSVEYQKKLHRTPTFQPCYPLQEDEVGLQIITNDKNIIKKADKIKIHQLLKIELNETIDAKSFEDLKINLKAFNPSLSMFQPNKEEKNILTIEGKFKDFQGVLDEIEKIAFKILKLDRIIIGEFTKWKLPRSKWRYLDDKEVVKLRKLLS